MQQQTTSAWIFQELSSVFENQIPSTYKHFYIDLQTYFPLVSLFFPYFPLVVVFMLDHFYSIISMTSNDEKALKKRSIQGCKATLVAAKCAPPEALRAGYPDLKRLGTYFGIYLGVGTVIFYALKNDIRGHKTIDFIDSLYLCVVTMTTVGYGDLVPHSYNAQLVCIFFITVGMCLFGIAVKIAAKYLVVKQQMVMVNALRMSRKIGPVEALKEIESVKIDYNKLKISLIAMAGHYVIGILVLLTIEGMDFTDAIYCAFTTMTTTGFGDETFQELFGRMFAVFWISTGTSCVGQLFLYIAEIYTDIETKKLAKQVISNNIIAKTDLEAADDIKDGKVYGAADMILYKLKEKGKIKQDDISVAMKDLNDVIKDVDVDDVTPPKSAQEK